MKTFDKKRKTFKISYEKDAVYDFQLCSNQIKSRRDTMFKKFVVYCSLIFSFSLISSHQTILADETYTLHPGSYEPSSFQTPFIVGQKGQIRRPSDSPFKDSNYSFYFKVDDPSILTFDEKGNWQALKPGTTTIHFFVSKSEKFEQEKRKLGIDHFITTEEIHSMQVTVLDSAINVYRLYNPNSGEPINNSERMYLCSLGWQDEGIVWQADYDGLPVRRYYNPNTGDHHFTLNFTEGIHLLQISWQDEGTAFYTHGDSGVMRLYHPRKKGGTHFFTTSIAEKEQLLRLGWQDEGVAFPFIGPE